MKFYTIILSSVFYSVLTHCHEASFYFKLDGLLGQYLFMNFSWYIGLDRRNEYPIEYSLESHGNIIIQSFIWNVTQYLHLAGAICISRIPFVWLSAFFVSNFSRLHIWHGTKTGKSRGEWKMYWHSGLRILTCIALAKPTFSYFTR